MLHVSHWHVSFVKDITLRTAPDCEFVRRQISSLNGQVMGYFSHAMRPPCTADEILLLQPLKAEPQAEPGVGAMFSCPPIHCLLGVETTAGIDESACLPMWIWGAPSGRAGQQKYSPVVPRRCILRGCQWGAAVFYTFPSRPAT